MSSVDVSDLADPKALICLKESPIGGLVWVIAGPALYYFSVTQFGQAPIFIVFVYCLVSVMGLASLFITRAALRIGVNGFEYSNCFGKTRYHWAEISQFYVTDPQSRGQQASLIKLSWQQIVGFDLRHDKTRPFGEAVFVFVMGTKNKIPGLFGVNARDLVAAMEHRRVFATSGAHQAGPRLATQRSFAPDNHDGRTSFGQRRA